MKKTVCLAFETSGRNGSVSVGIDGEILAETRFSGQLRHSAELFSAAEEMLSSIGQKPEEVGKIYCVIGPGSFTGIRISVTTAKMYALATNAKICGINTMDALALNASEFEKDTSTQVSKIATVIDAKRGLFFICGFEKQQGKWVKTYEDKLVKAEEFVAEFCQNSPVWLLGEGLVYYKDDFACENVKFLPEKYWPGQSKNVYLMGHQKSEQNEYVDPVKLAPFYLRGPDAKPKKGLKS